MTVGLVVPKSQRTAPFDHEVGATQGTGLETGEAAAAGTNRTSKKRTAAAAVPRPTWGIDRDPIAPYAAVIDPRMPGEDYPLFGPTAETIGPKAADSRPEQLGPCFEEPLGPGVNESGPIRDEEPDNAIAVARLEGP